MKHLFVILLFISSGASAQKKDVDGVMEASGNLIKALTNKDSVTLKQILSDDLSYGHSNGWIENKKEVINDLFNGKLVYKQVVEAFDSVKIRGKIASLRIGSRVEVELNGKPVKLDLKVLEVWIWEDKRWQLFARQSVKD